MAGVRNLFSLERRGGDEDQLTEMLVWLAEAVPAVTTAREEVTRNLAEVV